MAHAEEMTKNSSSLGLAVMGGLDKLKLTIVTAVTIKEDID